MTLVHFTAPRWLASDGGWTGAATGDRIARFTEFVAPALADAGYVATLNEPNLMAAQPVLGAMAMRGARFGPDGLVPPAPGLQTLAHGMERRPEALGAAVARAAEVLPEVPILVTENGIATADDDDRIRFTTDALAGLAAAIDGGADVRGYVHWSLLDNFEWMLGYRPTFGLVAVDRQTFARTPKPSLAWLGEVAKRNGLA